MRSSSEKRIKHRLACHVDDLVRTETGSLFLFRILSFFFVS